jgi:hypothetical protein
MLIKITAKKRIYDDVAGALSVNQEVDLPDQKAIWYINRGEATAIENKAITNVSKPLEQVIEAKVVVKKSSKK